MLLIGLVYGLLLVGCSTFGPPFSPELGSPEFRQWCQSAVNGEKKTSMAVLFKSAYHGDRKAIEDFLKMALDTQMSAKMNPADEMCLSWILQTLLYRQGDARFSSLLETRSSEEIAAVKLFLTYPELKASFPKTWSVLKRAPEIDFPLEKAYRQSDA